MTYDGIFDEVECKQELKRAKKYIEKQANIILALEKEIEKPSISIDQLKLITFKNIIEGSRSINGVTWNKIKRLKGKEKSRCLKLLSS